MLTTDVAVIGGGQSGLATSRSLSALGIDHVVLERGRAGERWFSQRWDSLNLLTTTGMSALPGLPHQGIDSDSFMPAAAFARYLDRYARAMAVPLISGATVRMLVSDGERFVVHTTSGIWRARAVVVATGACDTPYRPRVAAALDPRLYQIDAADYRRPADLPCGGVLVVGASASGVQLAEEIGTSGRAVTLSVGEHLSAPRRYRGKDIYAWLDHIGVLSERITDPAHRAAMLRQPSLQLIGTAANRDINLATLMVQGIRLTGRLHGATGRSAEFDGSLQTSIEHANSRKLKMLDRLDLAINRQDPDRAQDDSDARAPIIASREAETLDLYDFGIRSVVWATGYRRAYPWMNLAVMDNQGELIHDQGVLTVPGLFAMGLNFQRRRQSSFIGGCGQDAEDLAPLIKALLDARARCAA